MLTPKETRKRMLLLNLYNQTQPAKNRLSYDDIGVSKHDLERVEVMTSKPKNDVTTTFFGFRRRTGVAYNSHKSYQENLSLIKR